MKIVGILLGVSLGGVILVADGAHAAQKRIVCNPRLGACTSSVISSKPIAGMHCRMLNANWGRRRGGYVCT